MCLKVFVNGDNEKYNELKKYAMSLGSAFQKVNFLRDVKNDFENLNRTYFPKVDFLNFSEKDKNKIILEIESDFKNGLKGFIYCQIILDLECIPHTNIILVC